MTPKEIVQTTFGQIGTPSVVPNAEANVIVQAASAQLYCGIGRLLEVFVCGRQGAEK